MMKTTVPKVELTAAFCHEVSYNYPPGCLLQGKMSHIGENQGQFLLMVRPPACLPMILDEYYAQVSRFFSAQRSRGIVELIVRHKDLLTARRVGRYLKKSIPEDAHSEYFRRYCLSRSFLRVLSEDM
jgi:hypothetical protein